MWQMRRIKKGASEGGQEAKGAVVKRKWQTAKRDGLVEW